eukprot:COSAG04_NODE_629_length_11765_cov_11.121721_8_plen_203_part_00
MQADICLWPSRLAETGKSWLGGASQQRREGEARGGQVIPTPSHVLGRISPIFFPFFLVFCAFSPSRRGGSNAPQAGAQGQETVARAPKHRFAGLANSGGSERMGGGGGGGGGGGADRGCTCLGRRRGGRPPGRGCAVSRAPPRTAHEPPPAALATYTCGRHRCLCGAQDAERRVWGREVAHSRHVLCMAIADDGWCAPYTSL